MKLLQAHARRLDHAERRWLAEARDRLLSRRGGAGDTNIPTTTEVRR
ncbi:hypothetical protein JK386_08075 [Nocardioides sp. zg-536]|uniref:Uncharacterized protein n=1 Tax=Nocardioides faecalis TaxID=2803858 RepID=A0A938Y5Y6_9ACTN|nr:hypothetical protein [Nocardioides faecalis]MBM9459860.1 hypothetical protein [Nocardioides faecalis]MBS4754491.1 hypothetical protein [Nocardioides faecalis]QVI58902.1 hypothetical protein KG111_00400 [Nocardioides faecalis]